MGLPRVAIMLARQRSGTNALRRVLSGHPEIFTTPEVFHATPSPRGDLEVPMNFFAFLERHPKGTVTRSLSPAVQEEIFLDYLRFLRGFSDAPAMVIDVKLNSTHHFDGPWRAVTEAPGLFALIKKHEIPTLHLTRQNYLRYYLSWQMANETGTWTTEQDRAAAAARRGRAVMVDVPKLLHRMRRAHAEEVVTAEALWRKNGWLRIDYDELFPSVDAPIPPNVLARIAEWLGVSTHFESGEPVTRKQSRLSLREAIENYDEVEAALVGTRFEYCLEDERAFREAG